MACSNFSCSGSCGSSDSKGEAGCGQGNCTGDACLGWCGGGCLGCTGDCSGGCGGGCAGGCSDNCGSNCVGGCKGDCGTGCNTGCSTQEALDLYTTLAAGLNKKIYAADMNNINRMIEIEASSSRFNKSIVSKNFQAKMRAQSSWVKQLQTNLQEIGQSPVQNADVKTKSWKATGQELIDLVLASADTKIASNATGR